MNQSVLVPVESHYAMCMGNPVTLVYQFNLSTPRIDLCVTFP